MAKIIAELERMYAISAVDDTGAASSLALAGNRRKRSLLGKRRQLQLYHHPPDSPERTI